ncbi:MAG: phosphoribosylglycinamide formyltransferase [Syntrophobacteraceae bacterium]
MTQSKRRLRLALLVSGGGTNLQAIIDRSISGSLSADVSVVLSDRPDAFGLERARRVGIPAFCINYKDFAKIDASQCAAENLPVDLDELDRRQKILKQSDPAARRLRLASLVLAEQELIRVIDSYNPDYICLAGFMRLVTPYFINHFNTGSWKILNIHPALLPSFPGRHGYEDTFEYGCKWGGITVHFVDEGEDTGPIIAQAVYPVLSGDNLERVRARGLQLEYEVYAQVIEWLAQGEVAINITPEGRTRVVITDPRYARIMKSWVLSVLV